jgi:hypothetical protein
MLNGGLGYVRRGCHRSVSETVLDFFNVQNRVWCVNGEAKRRIRVIFNRVVRRIFGYHDYESVKHILFGFSMSI